jgi:type IV pilus biogenesis protein CpaD/CtpE
MRRLSPVLDSEARSNGVAWLTRYAAPVRCRFAILVVVLAWIAGCRNRDVERMTAIKDSVCACKSVSCAEQEMKAVSQSTIQSTHRTQAIARDVLACLAKLHAAERPSTDPDDPDAPDEEALSDAVHEELRGQPDEHGDHRARSGRPPPPPPTAAPPGAPTVLPPPSKTP